MKTFDHVITNPVGIHARPAGNLVKFAKGFDSEITITEIMVEICSHICYTIKKT